MIFGVFVDSDLTKSLSDIVNAVTSAGITQANFSTLTQVSNPKNALEWGFGLAVPITKLKDTATALAGLAQTIAQNNSGLTLSFSVAGTQTSQTPPCPIAGLLSDAGTQSQNLASGAGRSLGGILAMSTSIASISAPASGTTYAIYAFSSVSTGTSSSCALTVKYALGN